MLSIQKHIDNKQESFKLHPFFNRLREQNDFAEGMEFVSGLTFWVFVFQDLLHIISSQIKTTHLRRIAVHHKLEDAGHDKWFLEDMAYLGKSHLNNVEWLFSPEQLVTREITYRIVSEVFQGKDYQKIILILVLESAGHIFFNNVAKFVEAKGQDAYLKYFSSYHLDVEMNHMLFEEELKKELYNMVLSEEESNQAIAMIERVHTAFYNLFDHLLQSFTHNLTNEVIDDSQSLVA